MFWTDPSIPLALKGLIVDQGRVAAVIIFFIVILDSFQVTIRMDVCGENEYASRVGITEVGGGGDGERADGDGLANSDRSTSDLDRDGEQCLFLVLVWTCLNDMCDGARVEPKSIPSFREGVTVWL